MRTSMVPSATSPDRAVRALAAAPTPLTEPPAEAAMPETAELPAHPESGATFPWPSLALFPERLNYAIQRVRMTPAELAREIDASRKVVSNMRTRRNRAYGGSYRQALVRALDAPTDWPRSIPRRAK
jgi:hypothetical protein